MVEPPAGIEAHALAGDELGNAPRERGFAWRPDNWIDKLTGSTRFRTMVDAGASTDEVVAAWQDELAAFDSTRREHLLYGPYGGAQG